MADEASDSSPLDLATELTIAWLSNPNTRASADEVPAFLSAMHGAVTKLAAPQLPPEETSSEPEYTPAVSVRRSLASKDHLLSMIDGKPYKMLKRHLAVHGLTPAEYRERYGLRADYPMVAESYAETRRGLAKQIGLGSKGRAAAAQPVTAASSAEPADKPAKKSPAKPAAKSRAKPAAKTSAKPEAKAAAQPAAKSPDQQPAPISSAQPAAVPPAAPIAKAPAKSKRKPSAKRTARPKAAPGGKPKADTAADAAAQS